MKSGPTLHVVLVDRPGERVQSPWARRFYGAAKMERAHERFDGGSRPHLPHRAEPDQGEGQGSGASGGPAAQPPLGEG